MKNHKLSRQFYLAGMVAILLLAAALRLYALAADAPIYLTRSQDLSTDGPNTIGFARDWVLFGIQPPPNQKPALTWLAYGVFSTLGIGYWQANLVAVSTGLLAIVFAAAFAQQQFGRRVALLCALFMALNYSFLIYNRIPMVYTPLACGLTLALYCWGQGLRRPGWFFLCGFVTVFCILYIKIAGATFLAAAVVGLLILTWQRRRERDSEVWTPLLYFLIGAAVIAAIGWFHLFQVAPIETILPSDVSTRTFNPERGFEENIRFAMVSVLQFGIYSGFFGRILVLFGVAYVFTFYRGVQVLGQNPPRLIMSEIITLLYLVFTALMLLASNSQPFRFMIALIPPLSLTAALALDRWLTSERLPLPARFGRLQLVIFLIGLTYLLYQLLAGGVKLGYTLYLGVHLVDYQVILDLPILFVLLIGALLLALVGTLAFVGWLGKGRRVDLALPSPAARAGIALALVGAIVLGDLYQYWTWARAPEFTIVAASRQISRDLGGGAFLGGPYAYVLAMENNLPALPFYTYLPNLPPQTLEPQITHVAVDADSVLKDGPFNEEGLFRIYAEDMKHAPLLKSYTLRGYLVNLYQIKR